MVEFEIASVSEGFGAVSPRDVAHQHESDQEYEDRVSSGSGGMHGDVHSAKAILV